MLAAFRSKILPPFFGGRAEGQAMRRRHFFINIFLIFSTLNAYAGGWSSGGGELIKDSDNPWFLNNTTQINYCVLIDEGNFGATPEMITHQLRRALSYWQKQFNHAVLSNLPDFGQLKIASQTFRETNCDDHTTIRFQLGVLDKQQKDYLKDPTQYAAVTVRTNYDEIALKAKGFVYVSPMKGPLSYASDRTVEDAWSLDKGNLLYLTVLHELGHVFGLQHMGTLGDLMSEGFVESILLKQESTTKLPRAAYPDFFSLKSDGRAICPAIIVLPTWQRFFGVESINQCFRFEFQHDTSNMLFGKTKMRVYVSASEDEPMILAREIELAMFKFFPAFTSIIWLPSKQGVFSKKDLEKQVGPGVLGISGLSISKKGMFEIPDEEEKRTISVRFEQGKSTIFVDGVMAGDLVPLL